MPITQPTMTASLRRRVLIIDSRLLIPGIEPAVHKEASVEGERRGDHNNDIGRSVGRVYDTDAMRRGKAW